MVNVKRRKRQGGKWWRRFIQNRADIIQNIYLYENATDSILNVIKQGFCPFFHSELCVFPSVSPACVFSIPISSCQSLACPFLCCCPPAIVCNRFPSVFFFSLPPSAYKPETLPSALPRCWKWSESAKGVIMMSVHKHRTTRDCLDEGTDATGKLPTQLGLVVCYTVEQK